MKFNNYYFDEGAHILHSKNPFFLKKISAKNKKRFIKKKSIILNFRDNNEIGYPVQFNLHDLNFIEKIKIVFDNINLRKNQIIDNYYKWLVSSYGSYITDNFYKIYTKKYWRSSPREMSCDWLKNRLPKKNFYKTLKSLFLKNNGTNLNYDYYYYPKDGGFFNFFEEKYNFKNIAYNNNITKIDLKNKILTINDYKEVKYNLLVSSVPLVDYKNIIHKLPSRIKGYIDKLKYTKLLAFNFKIKKKKVYNFHWCYFYDKDIECSRMSILNNINQEINNDDFYLVQLEVFRRNDEKYCMEKIKLNVKRNLKKFFKIKDNDIFFEFFFQIEKAYPIPLIDTEKYRKLIISYLKKHHIFPMGLYGNWKYMWSDQSFYNGYDFDLLKGS